MGLRVSMVDSTTERQILCAMVSNSYVLARLGAVARPEYFQSSAAQLACVWLIDYLETYQSAPGVDGFWELFNVNSLEFKPQQRSVLRESLERLLEGCEASINPEYLVDKGISYFKRRSIELALAQAQAVIAKGKVEAAEEILRNFDTVQRELSSWIDPLDPNTAMELIHQESNTLYRFPGALGDLVGWLERGWLVGVMAPMKRGKSFWLWEFARTALLNHLKVVLINLEMPDRQIAERVYRGLLACSTEGGAFICPVFDCRLNQLGECRKPERKGRGRLLLRGDVTPERLVGVDWTPCDVCRGVPGGDYRLALWYQAVERPPMTDELLLKKLTAFRAQFGDSLRLKTYPAFSATIDDLVRDLDELERSHGFIPDVLVVDYADILTTSTRYSSTRDRLDEIWKALKRLAQERRILVVTATQSNRKSMGKRDLSGEDMAEDIRKLAHVDVFLGLNQTPEEKRAGLMRVSLIAHRDREFHPDRQVAVLEARDLGQVLLDSVWLERRDKDFEDFSGVE